MKKELFYKLLGLVFGLGLMLTAILNLIKPQSDFSEMENRTLSDFPTLNVETLLDGTFMDKFETYLSDQFILRDQARIVYMAYERLGGSAESNGVIVCEDGQLLEDIVVPTDEHMVDLAYSLVSFQENYPDVNVSVMIAPDAAAVIDADIPDYVNVADQSEILDAFEADLQGRLNWIDCYSIMKDINSVSSIYYKTDHHWTTLGAYYAFLGAANSLGIESPGEIIYTPMVVSNHFNGALSSTSGFCQDEEESLSVYLSEQTPAYVVEYVESGEVRPSLYFSEKLSEKDKYAVFFGGNYSVMDIRIAQDKDKSLLVIKDSFANSFIPFLLPYYKEIVVVDPRYYGGTVSDIMEEYSLTDVLFLYSGNTFFQDKNIELFLQVSGS